MMKKEKKEEEEKGQKQKSSNYIIIRIRKIQNVVHYIQNMGKYNCSWLF